MSDPQIKTTGRTPIATIYLWGEPGCDCGICEQWTTDRYAVAWYCGPVKEDIGESVPEWGPDAIAGGRVVCKPCHDEFYGVQNVAA